MAISWIKDADDALQQARQQDKPLLLDFNAAPAWGACARLDAEVYPDPEVENFITTTFLPVKIHIKEQPQTFQRFGAQWTPTMLILDAEGSERHRFEGYLPKDDFLAHLALGLAHAAFASEQWQEAERRYRSVVEKFPDTEAAPEALYWTGVSRYKAGDQSALPQTAQAFRRSYPKSTWAKRASVWAA